MKIQNLNYVDLYFENICIFIYKKQLKFKLCILIKVVRNIWTIFFSVTT